jgi:3-hydroxyacyl-[acyl-carrier-protein] dehydratase
MHGLSSDGQGEIKASFNFPPDFIGFQGHFPGKPILPGVCKIQAIVCMLEAATKKIPKLKEIVTAKFFAPATCNEELRFAVHQFPEGSDALLVKALVTHRDKKIADIHLRVVFEA